MKKFNYVVATPWPTTPWPSEPKALAAYMHYNSQVNYGTLEDAKGFLEYVKQQRPDVDWKIYKISLKNAL